MRWQHALQQQWQHTIVPVACSLQMQPAHVVIKAGITSGSFWKTRNFAFGATVQQCPCDPPGGHLPLRITVGQASLACVRSLA
jgi:hypothetical protein